MICNPAIAGNTGDATATAADIVQGKTAYVASGKVTGTMVVKDYEAEEIDIAPGFSGYVYYSISGVTGATGVINDTRTTSRGLIDRMQVYGGSRDTSYYQYHKSGKYLSGKGNGSISCAANAFPSKCILVNMPGKPSIET